MDLQTFREKGWMVCNLPKPQLIFEARDALEKKLAILLGYPIELEQYHTHAQDDAFHTSMQVALTEFYRQEDFGVRIMADQKSLLCNILGPDINVQRNPYLRMARPGKKQDNIGYHRDTFYGGSPFEISVLIPFVDLPKESTISVMSGTHVLPEDAFPVESTVSEDVTKGSAKHQLGFLYAPKLMGPSIEQAMEQVPLRMGQALFFHLSLVHGSIENTGSITRWSSDIRIMHRFAPVDLTARPTYYTNLSLSVVTESAHAYLRSNGKVI